MTPVVPRRGRPCRRRLPCREHGAAATTSSPSRERGRRVTLTKVGFRATFTLWESLRCGERQQEVDEKGAQHAPSRTAEGRDIY